MFKAHRHRHQEANIVKQDATRNMPPPPPSPFEMPLWRDTGELYEHMPMPIAALQPFTGASWTWDIHAEVFIPKDFIPKVAEPDENNTAGATDAAIDTSSGLSIDRSSAYGNYAKMI